MLDRQQARLDSARGRAALLLAVSTVSTSFLGGLTVGHRPTEPVAVLASALYLAVGVCATRVLWPGRGPLVDDPLLGAVGRFVDGAALQIRANERTLTTLLRLLSAGWLLLVAETVLWLAQR